MLRRHNREVAPMARKLTATVHLKLRFPERLRRQIEQAAERNRQSMNTEIIERLERSFQKVDDQARDRALVKETITSTLAQLDDESLAQLSEKWKADWERRLADAGVVNLLDKLREQAIREQASVATNEETKSQEADVVNLLDALRRQVQAREQSSAATSKETKKRTSTGDKS
jgi:hypothetical protein